MSLPRHLTIAPLRLESGAVSPVHCLIAVTMTLGPEFNQHLLGQCAETALGHKDLRRQVLAKVTENRRPNPKSQVST